MTITANVPVHIDAPQVAEYQQGALIIKGKNWDIANYRVSTPVEYLGTVDTVKSDFIVTGSKLTFGISPDGKLYRVLNSDELVSNPFTVVYFKTDKSKLTANQLEKLVNIPSLSTAVVRTFADERNTRKYNKKLTDYRARHLIKQLNAMGVDVSEAYSFGEEKAVASSKNEYYIDRRGEILVQIEFN